MTKQIEHWYRFEDQIWIDYDGVRNVSVYLTKFVVTKHTLKGVWLEYGFEKDKFVLKNSRKRFACPTVEEAKISFLARKQSQLCILEAQVAGVRMILTRANTLMNEEVLHYGQENCLQRRLL